MKQNKVNEICSRAQTEGIFGEQGVCVHSLLTSALIGGDRRH
jgi:hypothetical protein